MTTWTRDALWWQVYPLGFTGAPIRPPAGQRTDTAPTQPAHGLRRIEAWLDHLLELGLNGLALGPVFSSESHGYDTLDHFAIDPRLGTDGDSTTWSRPPEAAASGSSWTASSTMSDAHTQPSSSSSGTAPRPRPPGCSTSTGRAGPPGRP